MLRLRHVWLLLAFLAVAAGTFGAVVLFVAVSRSTGLLALALAGLAAQGLLRMPVSEADIPHRAHGWLWRITARLANPARR